MSASIEIPPVVVRALDVVERGEDAWIYFLDTPGETREVPVDFYLREALSFDPSDAAQAIAFMRDWGVPFDPMHRDLVHGDETLLRRGNGNRFIPIRDEREGVAIDLGWVVSVDWNAEKPPVDELVERRKKIDRLIHIAHPLRRMEEMQRFCRWARDGGSSLGDRGTVRRLNAALTVFAPHIVTEDVQVPSIYNVVAAQIINDIHDGTQILTCQNETCRRKFTKQRGRAEYGAYRSKGVLYCSKTCAKAQAQRELRRRRRTEKGSRDGEA